MLPRPRAASLTKGLSMEESRCKDPSGCGAASPNSAHSQGSEDEDVVTIAAKSRQGHCRWNALDPNETRRIVFDLCGVIVLACELTVTPYMVAWGLPALGVLKIWFWITLVFWMSDIVMSFTTGFYHEGEVEMKFSEIAKNYLHTYFFLDITVVASEFASLVLDQTGHAVRFVLLMRCLRLMRMLRFVRLIRILSSVLERRQSHRAKIIAHGLAFCAGVLWIAHMLACVWYALGNLAPSDTGVHWISALATGSEPRRLLYEYLTSYHFSLQLLAAGSMDVSPKNSVERQFNIFSLLLGWLFGSSIQATVSTVMIEAQMGMRDKQHKIDTLQQFMDENGVGRVMAARVRNQVRNKVDRVRRIAEDDVQYLELISPALRAELNEHMYLPHLERYPLFRVWVFADDVAVRQLVLKGVRVASYVTGDVIFQTGALADNMFLLVSGKIRYTQDPDTSIVVEKEETLLDDVGRCLAEAALWSQWVHVGTCESASDCALLAINAPVFAQIVGSCRVLDCTLEYGRVFFDRLRAAQPPNASFPTDVQIPNTEYSELVMSMDFPYRTLIGTAALHAFEAVLNKQMFNLRQSDTLEELQREVQTGKCLLIQTGEGDLVRITAVTVLYLERESGEIFAQVGKVEGGELIVDCKLPGSKLEHGENLRDACERMVDKVTADMAGSVVLTRVDTEVSWGTSSKFGIRTKYLKTINYATLTPGFQMPEDSSTFRTWRHADHDVHCILRDNHESLYMWVHQDEYKQLSSPSGRPALEAMLAPLQGHHGVLEWAEVPLLAGLLDLSTESSLV